MQGHNRETTGASVKPEWNDASNYQTETEYVAYVQSLPHKTQRHMAKAGVVTAQRLLACYLQDREDYKESSYWWTKAAENNDPLALLHEADVLRLQKLPDEAKMYCDRALAAVKDHKDAELARFVNEVAANILQYLDPRVTSRNNTAAMREHGLFGIPSVKSSTGVVRASTPSPSLHKGV